MDYGTDCLTGTQTDAYMEESCKIRTHSHTGIEPFPFRDKTSHNHRLSFCAHLACGGGSRSFPTATSTPRNVQLGLDEVQPTRELIEERLEV